MSDPAICLNPQCRQPVTIPAAGAPDGFRCPHCGTVLRPAETGVTWTAPSACGPAVTWDDARIAPAPGMPGETWDAAQAPATVSSAAWPARIGRFLVRGRLGEGAFGIVYRAYDPQMDRDIALKVAKPDTLSTARRVERFLREGKAAGQLRHPHIVPVFETGQDGARYFIANAYIAGHTLAETLEKNGEHTALAARDAARIVRQLAEALAYAHSKGVVHRDVKPANVMVDEQGEPVLMDFGLAARAEDEERLTQDGGRGLGTPAYMAPEQAAGQAGPASDQYSLGCTLHELLTGRTPFAGPPELQLFLHQTEEAPSLRKQVPALPRDLETICLKCLEKDPSRRYGDCQALADDLRRWQEGDPIAARRLSVAERAVRWARREPKLAIATAVAVLALVAVAAITTVSARTQAELTRLAQQETDRAQKQTGIANEASAKAREAAEQSQLEADKARKVAGVLAGLFEASDPMGLNGYSFFTPKSTGERLTARTILDRGVERVRREFKEQPVIQAALLHTLGDVYRSLGQFQQAEPLLRGALDLRRQLGHADLEIADSMHALGWLYFDHGDYRQAEDLYRQALALRVKQLGEDHLQVANSKFNLAWLASQSYDFETAEQLFGEVVAVRKKQLGEEHRETALAMFGLACPLIETRRYAEATPLVLKASGIFLKLEGNQNLALAVGAFQRALMAQETGFTKVAETQFRESLDLTRKGLGDRHPYTAVVQCQLAVVQAHNGNTVEAEKNLRECLDVARVTVGLEHPRSIVPIEALADLLREQDKAAEGAKLFQELIATRRQRYGEDHVTVAEGLTHYGAFLAEGDDSAGAEQAYRDADAVFRKGDAARNRDFAQNCVSLGNLIQDKGQLAEAEKLFADAVAVCRRITRRDPEALPIAMWTLAGNQLFQKKFADAEVILAEADSYCRQTDAIKARTRINVAIVRGRCARDQGKAREAIAPFQEALDLVRKEQGGKPVGTVDFLVKELMILELKLGDLAEAEQLVARSADASAAGRLDLVNRLFPVLNAASYARATPIAKQGVELARQVHASQPQNQEMYLARLAAVLADQGQYAAARPILDELLALKQKHLPENAPELVPILRDVALVRAAAGDLAAARAACENLAAAYGPKTRSDVLFACTAVPDALAEPGDLVKKIEADVGPDMKRNPIPNVIGRAYYRAGAYTAALEQLIRAEKEFQFKGRPRDRLFLALTAFRLGNAADARDWLDKAVQEVDAAAKKEGPGSQANGGLFWQNKVVTHLLRQEADKLLPAAP